MKLALIRRGYSATGGAEAYLSRFAGACLRRPQSRKVEPFDMNAAKTQCSM